jgi:hypothetical protein
MLMKHAGRLLPSRLYNSIMKQTFYGQFVAGDTERELLQTAERFFDAGIRSIPEACIEGELEEEKVLEFTFSDGSEEHLDYNLSLLEKCVGIGEKLAKAKGMDDHLNTKIGVKLSSIISPSLLTCLSSTVLRNGNLPLVEATEIHAMMEKSAMTFGYHDAYRRALDRLDKLLQKVSSSKITVLLSAEHSYMQPAICAIVLYMQSKYNIRRPVVYNTEQAYLKKAVDTNKRNLEIAQLSGFYYASKVVRGAYMDSERARARRLHLPDPVHDSYEDANYSYDHIVNGLLERVAMGEVKMVIATHNEKSINMAVKQMQSLGISRHEGDVSFAQLMGACDHVTFSLGMAAIMQPIYI